MKSVKLALLCSMLAAASPLNAEAIQHEEGAVSQNHWRMIAEKDARAALKLIEENHPGAAPSLGDEEFLERIRVARAHLHARLPQVDSFTSYDAVMSGLAADFGDGHIWSNSFVQFQYRAWAGIILRRQGGIWLVGAHSRLGDEESLLGRKLISCDDRDAEVWAKERIGLFRGNAEIEAQLSKNAAWLLLRDGNPFLDRPKSCTFADSDGRFTSVTLAWRQAHLSEIQEVAQLIDGNQASAGLEIKPFAGGYWIGLGTLEREANEVVERVKQMQHQLAAAPVLVIDLRGNGGGDSSYAEAIARQLFDDSSVDAAQQTEGACNGAFWRASPGNLEALHGWRDRLPATDDGSRSYVSNLISKMEDALVTNSQFAPRLSDCAASSKPQPEPIAGASDIADGKNRLVLVTDQTCFSSCLIAVDIFLKLGALHVGEATDVSTMYMEVREVVLPSGIRTFSTLQKVALGSGGYGPYEPAVLYPGDLADTEALKNWVAEIVAP